MKFVIDARSGIAGEGPSGSERDHPKVTEMYEQHNRRCDELWGRKSWSSGFAHFPHGPWCGRIRAYSGPFSAF